MSDFHILIVNEDSHLCRFLHSNLTSEGYNVKIANSAEDALSKKLIDFNLIITDITFKEMSGFKLAHSVRNTANTSTIPLLFLTSKSTENDRLTAYSVGADDFMSIPFSIRELLARIRAILKRTEIKVINSTEILTYDNLQINILNKQVLVDGDETQFTKKEFEILKLLLENKNRLFTRSELLQKIWPEDAFVLGRTIDVNITRIRHKIGRYDKHIVTKLGLGYFFEG